MPYNGVINGQILYSDGAPNPSFCRVLCTLILYHNFRIFLFGVGSFDGDRTRDLQCDRLASTPLLHEAICALRRCGGEILLTAICLLNSPQLIYVSDGVTNHRPPLVSRSPISSIPFSRLWVFSYPCSSLLAIY